MSERRFRYLRGKRTNSPVEPPAPTSLSAIPTLQQLQNGLETLERDGKIPTKKGVNTEDPSLTRLKEIFNSKNQ